MSDTPDPLPPGIAAFLEPERRRPDPPADVQNDVFSRIGATLGLPRDGGGPDGNGNGPDGAGPAAHGSAGEVAAGAAKGVALGSLAKTVITLIVGGVLGAGVHEAFDRRAERVGADRAAAQVPAAAPSAVAAPPAPEPASETPPAIEARAERPPTRPEHNPRVQLRERDRDLGAERTLIEQARTALSREQGATALAALERHARDFPLGELQEERESLQVQALVALERYEQARKAGARFHRRFPRSIFGAVVDEALRSIP
jgi:hypothetical protein